MKKLLIGIFFVFTIFISNTDAKELVKPIPAPESGLIRIGGPLNSVGEYNCDVENESTVGRRGASWTASKYGKILSSDKAWEDSNAWFFADINPQDGKIAKAGVYFSFPESRFMTVQYGMLDKPVKNSYGKIGKSEFKLTIKGARSSMRENGKVSVSDMPETFVIYGKGNLLDLKPNQTIKGNYMVTEKENSSLKNMKTNWDIMDFGTTEISIVNK